MNIHIDSEFRDLIPPLQLAELDQLHASIRDEGCRDPLIVWQEEQILVDGHNRYAFCSEHGINMNFIERQFASRQAVKNFIILNQLGRRNVDPDTASMLRGMLYNGTKKDEHDGGRGKNRSGDQNDTHSTAETIAHQTGVSAPTVKRDGKFAEALEKLGMSIAEFKASGKSKKAIIAEAFPPKKQPTPIKEDRNDAEAEVEEFETVIEDGTKEKPVKFIESNGMGIFYVAKSHMDKIAKNDTQRVEALQAMADYCKERISKKK